MRKKLNRYEEALNTLYDATLDKVSSVDKEKAYQTLQELIESYQKLQFELDKKNVDYDVYKKSSNKLEKENKIYKIALSLATKMLKVQEDWIYMKGGRSVW